jgi:hypothetical protein
MIHDMSEGNLTNMDDTEDEDEDICVGCGMEKSEWKGNNGEGYTRDGMDYCCTDCAEGIECGCGM